jgi:hypothetical protein
LTSLDVSSLTKLKKLDCNFNYLTSLLLNKSAPYEYIDLTYNSFDNASAIKGRTIPWNTGDFYYSPQRAIDTTDVTPPTDTTSPAAFDLSQANITVKDKVYTGKRIKSGFKVTRKVREGTSTLTYTLKEGKHYTVSTKGKNTAIGKWKLTLTGKGACYGAKVVSFKIVPRKVAVKSAFVGKRKADLTIKKLSKGQAITYYQVRCRMKGKTKWGKAKTFKTTYKTGKAFTVTIKKLKKGKRYEFQARAYKIVGGEKYYGAWSWTQNTGKVE